MLTEMMESPEPDEEKYMESNSLLKVNIFI